MPFKGRSEFSPFDLFTVPFLKSHIKHRLNQGGVKATVIRLFIKDTSLSLQDVYGYFDTMITADIDNDCAQDVVEGDFGQSNRIWVNDY